MATCKSCAAPIHWVKTTSGKNIPLDAVEVSDGNIVRQPDGRARVYRPGAEIPPGLSRYKTHLATCPDAARYRPKNLNPVAEAAAIRDTVWRIRTRDQPVRTAYVMLVAAAQFLNEDANRSIDQLKATVAEAVAARPRKVTP